MVILNPAAGRGDGGRRAPLLREALTAAGLRFQEVRTSRQWEAAELAERAARQGYPVVAAAGGDGTVHEVVNGLLAAVNSRTCLAIFAIGSGSDFAYALGLPRDISQAVRLLTEARVRQVDVGRANERYFVNSLGAGFDALVAIESRKVRLLRGFLMYLVAVFRTLRDYRLPTVWIELDGVRTQRTITTLEVANGRRAGGGFLIAPEARVDDGLFDVFLARGLNRLEILRLLPEVIRGTHVDKEPVTMVRARRVIVESEEPLPVYADGEILDTAAHRLEVEILPGRLCIIGVPL